MESRWYTRRHINEAEKGPFTKAMLVKAMKSGELSSNMLVRREGRAEWSEIGDHPAFASGWDAGQPGAAMVSSPADAVNPAVDSKTSPGLWLAAVPVLVIHAGIRVSHLLAQGEVGPAQVGEMVGIVLGTAVVPFLIVLIGSLGRATGRKEHG
jgi:hypothetical protein